MGNSPIENPRNKLRDIIDDIFYFSICSLIHGELNHDDHTFNSFVAQCRLLDSLCSLSAGSSASLRINSANDFVLKANSH